MSDEVFIGIDPSLSASAVCVWNHGGPKLKVFKSEPAWDSSIVARHSRYWKLYCGIKAFLLDHVPATSVACIEGYGSSARGHSQVPMIEYGWNLRRELMDFARLIEVPPACVKKFATGKGNADKMQVALAVQKRYDVTFDSSDEFDAYVLARIAACYAGYEEPENEKQREVIAVLKTEKKRRKSA